MGDKRVFILAHEQARQRAAQHCMEAPAGQVVTFDEPKKKREQEEKYHAQIGDIAKQTKYAGQRWGREDMKRILIDEFAEEMRLASKPLHDDTDGRIIPSENGRRVIQLGIQSRGFWVQEASEFIEFLYAWGAERDVHWSEPAAKPAKQKTGEAMPA